MIRRLIVIWLALLLPLNGWALTRLAAPCPMQMSKTTNPAAMKSTCCEDHQKTNDKAGNPCKAGQECQTSTLHFASTFIAPIGYFASAQSTLPFASQIASTAPSGVWRPPRL